MRPYLEKNITKKGWWSGSRCRPWVQTPVLKKKKKIKNRQERMEIKIRIPVALKPVSTEQVTKNPSYSV
jgi:hypothetical protein